jgi:hypothetical protein
MYCIYCGKELPEGAKFCMECGAKVHAEDQLYFLTYAKLIPGYELKPDQLYLRRTWYGEDIFHKIPEFCREVLSAVSSEHEEIDEKTPITFRRMVFDYIDKKIRRKTVGGKINIDEYKNAVTGILTDTREEILRMAAEYNIAPEEFENSPLSFLWDPAGISECVEQQYDRAYAEAADELNRKDTRIALGSIQISLL